LILQEISHFKGYSYCVLRKPYGLQDIGRVFKEAMLQSA
jgi:hypothetical protein